MSILVAGETMQAEIPQREFSTGEILRKSLNLYFARFELFFTPFLLANLVFGGLGQLLDRMMPRIEVPSSFTEESLLWLFNYLSFTVPVMAVYAVFGCVLTALAGGIAVKLASDLLERRPTALKVGLQFTLASFPTLLAAGLIVGALTVLGFILFLIPGVIMAVMFSLTVQVIIIERLNVFESLRRSRKLVADRWLQAFTILFTVFILTVIFAFVGSVIGDILDMRNIALKWVTIALASSVVQPLQPIALTYLYYSMCTREKILASRIRAEPVITGVPSAPQPSAQVPTFSYPRFCYKCGQRLPPGSIYCPQCGVRVKA